MPVLMYLSETIIWKDPKCTDNRVVQNDEGVDKRIDEDFLLWFGHVERMENDRIAKRVYVVECVHNRSVGRPQKRRIDTVKECLKKG